MARDYKTRRKSGRGFSGWLGVMLGLAAGLAVAGIVYLKDRHADAPAAQSAKAYGKKRVHGSETPDTDGGDPGAVEEPAKTYDFYSMLPKFEVVVPEREKDVRPDVRGVPETRRGTYVLQAG